MAKFEIVYSSSFKKDLKKYIHDAESFDLIRDCIRLLEEGGCDNIPLRMKPHQLFGNYKNYRECHIKSDLLLIWHQDDKCKTVALARVGSHANLFD